MWTQSRFSSVFQSHSFDRFVFWLAIIVLPSHEHNSPRGMQWISWGSWGIWFVFPVSGSQFFSITLFNFLSRNLTLPWGHRGEPPVPPPQFYILPHHVYLRLETRLVLFNEILKRTHDGKKKPLKHQSIREKHKTHIWDFNRRWGPAGGGWYSNVITPCCWWVCSGCFQC